MQCATDRPSGDAYTPTPLISPGCEHLDCLVIYYVDQPVEHSLLAAYVYAIFMSYCNLSAELAQPAVIPSATRCFESAGSTARVQGGWDGGPTGAPAADAWLTGLKLLAVQPACLRASSGPSDGRDFSAQPASETSVEQEQRKLHLQLEAMLSNRPTTLSAQTDLSTAPCNAIIGPSPLPILLQQAVLELTVLSKQALLLRQQHSLLQLLLNEQLQLQQQSAQHAPAAVSIGPASSGSSSWTVSLHLQFTCPSQPSTQPLGYLDLILSVRTAEQKPQQQHVIISSTGSVDGESVQPAVGLVAEIPLLMLPAVAQQEVQQLLLPAMREEVQAEQQQQQQEQGQGYAQGNAHAQGQASEEANQSIDSLQIESIVWRHYQQLVNDIHTVMLLVDMIEQPAAEAAASSIAAEAAAAAAAAEAATQQQPESAKAVDGPQESRLIPTHASPSEAPAGPVGLSSSAALASIGDNLLFPLLLPFLAAHGLHNLLQLLVSCLPGQLQQQWQEQQEERLRQGQATAAAAGGSEAGQASETAAVTPGEQAALSAAGAVKQRQAQQKQPLAEIVCGQQQQEQLDDRLQNPPSSDALGQQQQPDQQQEEEDEEDLKGSIQLGAAGSVGVAAVLSAQGTRSAAAAGVDTVAWYSPMIQFNREVEARYLAWKHHSLIHLDYIGALFAVMYLLALVRRMISEPTTLFYFVYVLLKCMPLAPLILGFRKPFLRYRELWLWLVIPASLLTFLWFTAVQKIATPTTLLPQKAISAYWNGHGEIMTSAMRPFIQHMRLRPYVAYTLADAAMVVWVFAQFYGWWAAVGRWGFAAALSISLCWGLDLHMRKRFVVLQS